ncbi:MAG: hypothetical protein Q7R57_01735 [Dehalococcoidales bacterium]|nr:hypothetical protein [Dehalococcoidales bacterium]
MMKIRFVWIIAAIIAMLGVTGCANGGDTQKLAGDLAAAQSQLTVAQGQLTTAQNQTTGLRSQLDQANTDLKTAKDGKTAAEGKLTTAQNQVTQLQDQLSKLKDNQLTGATPEETARKIVKFYNETHVYSIGDLFECGDMSQDVWNMLKAQNINARIQIGSTKVALKDIQDSDHAWVLAEIAPAKYLALETTGGFAVTQAENPFYFQGWAFKSPKDYKDYVTLLNEYIWRQNLVNDMSKRYNQMVTTYNSQYGGRPPLDVQGKMSQALDEINLQKAALPGLLTKMKALVG